MAEVFDQTLGDGLAGIECTTCGHKAVFTTSKEAEDYSEGWWMDSGDGLECPGCGDLVTFCDYTDHSGEAGDA